MDFELLFELFVAENELPDDPEEEALQFVSWVIDNKDRPDVKRYLEDDDDGFDRRKLAWGKPIGRVERN
jgi:hypothetical protein